MSRDFTYEPHVGYGPLKFGMSAKQIVDILGEPKSEFVDADVLDMDLFDADEKALILTSKAFNYDDAVLDHDFLSVTFFQDKLVEIRIRVRGRDIPFGAENLMDNNRKDLMRRLAENETEIYANGASYFFPKAGLQTDDPKFWKSRGTVDFVVGQYVLDRLDLDSWERLSEIDL
ncbi:hypothetical protein [uncultured Litoreibacter sp.]|uniref:hypothetical protein n=1 Tax=uncultured Litoreibacter sp. TaxID=1392394 RepID=UPI002609E08C|nr:hypothetical protein [uncultured Litoreibacter sp.]